MTDNAERNKCELPLIIQVADEIERLATELAAVKTERDALREQVAAGDALRISMADVPENILDWASYASEHFQEKYGMQDDADRYKKALSAYDVAISKGETNEKL